MNADDRELGENLYKLVMAYLVDHRGGQLSIPLKDLTYTDCAVRIVLNLETETAVVTLTTQEQALMPLSDCAKRIVI